MALLTLSRGDDRLVDLPTSWSNAGRKEQLQRAAAESFSNLVALAVAKSGANFQLYDALRPIEEQIAMLEQNYRRVSRGRSKSSDRTWDGSTWEKRPGRPDTASPRTGPTTVRGLAIDIHPGPIQEIFKAEGRAWGWSWDEGQEERRGLALRVTTAEPVRVSRMARSRLGENIVGAKIDGKIGVGTVKLIKAWQAEHGLEADGIVGPGTKAAMLGKAVADAIGDVAEDVAEAVSGSPSPSMSSSPGRTPPPRRSTRSTPPRSTGAGNRRDCCTPRRRAPGPDTAAAPRPPT